MAKKPSVRELRQHLAAKSPPELIAEIITLYTRYEAVKEFYMAQLHGSYDQELLDRYKAIITNEFFTRSAMPGPGRIGVARRAVMDYKKLAASPERIAEIMVHYVEIGVAYTCQFGDISAPFYASMERMYAAAITHILEHDLEGQFQDRCKQIMRRTDGIGWGFNDTMMDIYYKTWFQKHLTVWR
ncbi:hypothetical protein K2Z83_26940, partial [Oscillochloris sp. ZM17-4]|uniref:DUF6155 family protein n=1 Tax=Oscillochloris sp. ZM17-4 TaxID=2866714 RepID=UPI001C72CADF